jgi:hypothetical protein
MLAKKQNDLCLRAI